MATRSPIQGRAGNQVVRLSQVPQHTRLLVANRIIRVEGLVGIPALEMILAATEPVQDPWLILPTERVREVLR